MGISNQSTHSLGFSTGINFTRHNDITNRTCRCCFPAYETTNRYFIATTLNMTIRCIYIDIFQVKIFDCSTTIYSKETKILSQTIVVVSTKQFITLYINVANRMSLAKKFTLKAISAMPCTNGEPQFAF